MPLASLLVAWEIFPILPNFDSYTIFSSLLVAWEMFPIPPNFDSYAIFLSLIVAWEIVSDSTKFC